MSGMSDGVSHNHPQHFPCTPAYSGELQTQSSSLASRNLCSTEKKASDSLATGEELSRDPGVGNTLVGELSWGGPSCP